MAWFEATLTQKNKECAFASLICAAPAPMTTLPQSRWALGDFKPSALRKAHHSRPLDGNWFGDVLDYTVDDERYQHWFSFRSKGSHALSPTAFATTIADYAAGISRPDSWEAPSVRAFPNPMMSVVLNRAPVPGWAGLQARSVWD